MSPCLHRITFARSNCLTEAVDQAIVCSPECGALPRQTPNCSYDGYKNQCGRVLHIVCDVTPRECERKNPPPLARVRMRLGCRGYRRRVVEPSIQSPLWRPAFVPLSAVASSRGCRLASLPVLRSPWRPTFSCSRLCRVFANLHG